jgi:hypothetical protein
VDAGKVGGAEARGVYLEAAQASQRAVERCGREGRAGAVGRVWRAAAAGEQRGGC